MSIRLKVFMSIHGNSKQNPGFGSNRKNLVFYPLQTSTCRGKLKKPKVGRETSGKMGYS